MSTVFRWYRWKHNSAWVTARHQKLLRISYLFIISPLLPHPTSVPYLYLCILLCGISKAITFAIPNQWGRSNFQWLLTWRFSSSSFIFRIVKNLIDQHFLFYAKSVANLLVSWHRAELPGSNLFHFLMCYLTREDAAQVFINFFFTLGLHSQRSFSSQCFFTSLIYRLSVTYASSLTCGFRPFQKDISPSSHIFHLPEKLIHQIPIRPQISGWKSIVDMCHSLIYYGFFCCVLCVHNAADSSNLCPSNFAWSLPSRYVYVFIVLFPFVYFFEVAEKWLCEECRGKKENCRCFCWFNKMTNNVFFLIRWF